MYRANISVIIPLYNKGLYISQAIHSVLAQTAQNFEIIVVDDGSTDNGADIVKEFADSRIMLIRQDNRGPGVARNRGIREAKGEYISFLDADDEWLPLFLEKGIEFLSVNKDIAAISCGYDTSISNSDKDTAYWYKKGVRNSTYDIDNETNVELVRSLVSFMCSCTIIVRKSCLIRYGGFYDKWKCLYGEDDYLWIKIILNEKIGISTEKLVIYHTEASQLNNNNLSGPHPVEPFLLDPLNIIEHCPLKKRDLLSKILAIRAIHTSIHYAKFGLRKEGEDLLNRYCMYFKPRKYYKAFLYSKLAPILPLLRVCYRKIKYGPSIGKLWSKSL
jgi:glycosyltransferase involved in cell wall biosynthesis